MSKGAICSLVFASTVLASNTLGYIFVNSAQQIQPSTKSKRSTTADPSSKRFHLFGGGKKSSGRDVGSSSKSSGASTNKKNAPYILAPGRGQHPQIVCSSRIDERLDQPEDLTGGGESGGAGRAATVPRVSRRVQSAPIHQLIQTRDEHAAQLIAQQETPNSNSNQNTDHPTSPNPIHRHPTTTPASSSTPTATATATTTTTTASTHAKVNGGDLPPTTRTAPPDEDENDMSCFDTSPSPSTTATATAFARNPAAMALKAQLEKDESSDDEESDWDEGVAVTAPRPLRCSSVAFPLDATLSLEMRNELLAEFEKSVKPCENWDDDFDIDVETESLQVPSAVAAAQFSVKMDLHNIQDFAKQIEALKVLRSDAQGITELIKTPDDISKLTALRYKYANDWEQAEVIIDLGEIAHDDETTTVPGNREENLRSVVNEGSPTAVETPTTTRPLFSNIDGDEVGEEDPAIDLPGPPTKLGANLPSEKHLNVLKDILIKGLSREAQDAIRPFLVGDSVQFSVEMMPSLLAHLKRLSERLEVYLGEMRALQTS